ncbi:hypothetical protein PCL_05705 [Purpureocillium lilacinum]|uniref:Uncharacterized protein n=1 Tax=Purpureocillium lilacinum TaxID=33203 RepID=A0A2U3EKK6_PURLI|nr:hypothetical protein PCL_05705 [Purpureocillium lilacinum]
MAPRDPDSGGLGRGGASLRRTRECVSLGGIRFEFTVDAGWSPCRPFLERRLTELADTHMARSLGAGAVRCVKRRLFELGGGLLFLPGSARPTCRSLVVIEKAIQHPSRPYTCRTFSENVMSLDKIPERSREEQKRNKLTASQRPCGQWIIARGAGKHHQNVNRSLGATPVPRRLFGLSSSPRPGRRLGGVPPVRPPSRTRLLGDLICKRRDGGMSLNERRANVRLPKGSLWPWPRARERAEDHRFAVRAEVCDVGREIIRRFHTMRLTMMSEGWVVMTGRTVYSGAARVCFKQRNGTPLSGGLLWPVDERGPQEQLALAIGTWQAEALITHGCVAALGFRVHTET